MVKELIDAGANVNQSDGNKTPIIATCEMRHWNAINMLIKKGADVNQSDRNKTPLTAAYERRHVGVVLELKKLGLISIKAMENKRQ